MTTRAFVSLFVLVLAAGCGGTDGAAPDAGVDAGSTIHDAGLDAAPTDAGTDAARADAGGEPHPASDGGGSILPPVDGGDPFGDAGALGEPEWVDVVVHTDDTTCDPLVPCGGGVVGTWDVSGGCVEVPIETPLSRCPGATVTSSSGRARGRVVFGDTLAHRVAQSEVDVRIFVPGVCAAFVGGCNEIEARIRTRAPDAACVMQLSGDCLCEARQISSIDDTDTYSLEGDQIVGGLSEKRWDYCVSGDGLRYRDVSPSGTREPGIIELVRR